MGQVRFDGLARAFLFRSIMGHAPTTGRTIDRDYPRRRHGVQPGALGVLSGLRSSPASPAGELGHALRRPPGSMRRRSTAPVHRLRRFGDQMPSLFRRRIRPVTQVPVMAGITLGELSRRTSYIRVTCKACRHVSRHKPGSLALRVSPGTAVSNLRFRCRCGNRECLIDIVSPRPDDPEIDGITWAELVHVVANTLRIARTAGIHDAEPLAAMLVGSIRSAGLTIYVPRREQPTRRA